MACLSDYRAPQSWANCVEIGGKSRAPCSEMYVLSYVLDRKGRQHVLPPPPPLSDRLALSKRECRTRLSY